MAHAAEWGHFYSRSGEPFYEIVGANGKLRSVNLKDARKLGLVPGVTTIINCADKPGLTRWRLDQMLHAALTLPRMPDEPEADWISRVWTDSQETAKKAAERGTAIHAAIQGHFEGEPPSEEMFFHVTGAVQQLNIWTDSIGVMGWEPEQSFAHPLGFGGKVDLSAISGEGLVYAPGFVVDVKTKEFGFDADLKTWDEHALQLAAYREGLKLPKARAAICYVSVTNPGLSRLIEIPEEDLERGWEMFVYLLGFWKAKTRFNSAWQEQKAA